MKEVTDAAILEQLNRKEVTDPAIIAQLEGKSKKPSLSFMQQLAKAGTSSLPAIGAVVGSAPGVIGTPFTGGASLPLAVAGAAGGAGIGASIQKLIEQNFGLSEPETAGQQYTDIGKEMVYGGLSPAGGSVGAKASLGMLGNKLSPVAQETAQVAKQAGIVPSISMLRPDSKIEGLIGKLPLASLFQRNQLSNVIKKTGEFAKETQNELFETSVTAAKKQQGQLYQQGLDVIPTERLPMPKTVEYVKGLLKSENISDVVSSLKNNPDLAGVSSEVMDEILKTAVKNVKPKTLPKQAMATLEGFLQSVDQTGTVSKEMLGTFKANLGKSKVGTVVQKELNRLMRSEMPEDAAKLWLQGDEAYSYLSKLKPVEDIFKASFTNKQGFKEFNPAQFTERYAQALSDEAIPTSFKPVMDKLNTLAQMSTKSAQAKAEMKPIAEIVWNILGAGGLVGATFGTGTTPVVAMALSSLALARSSTAKNGIIRKLATSGVMSKEASEVLGELAGRYATVGMVGSSTTKQKAE
jgi:uncharacterized protein YcfJ